MSGRGFVDVEALADHVLSQSGAPRTSNSVAVDVEQILAAYCRFDVAHIPQLVLGGVRLSGAYLPEHQVVLVEATDASRKKRFTMAHELGHAEIDFGSMAGGKGLFEIAAVSAYRCSPDDVGYIEVDDVASRREMLANKFAACLLMPSGLAREVWRRTRDVEKFAATLDVSREAAGYRLKELRLH